MSYKVFFIGFILLIWSVASPANCESPFKRPSIFQWISFEDAKAFIQSQGIKTAKEFEQWKRAGNRPKNFPSTPQLVYREWVSWPHFFGTEKEFMSFEDAKAFIQSQGIISRSHFRKWVFSGNKPKNFPSHPNDFYKEWVSWNDFLNTNNPVPQKKEFMSYEDAKAYIQRVGIKTSGEFEQWKRAGNRPDDFPSVPFNVYKTEWISWNEFLNSGNISTSKKEFMSYEDAKAYIQSQGIKTDHEFRKWKQAGNRPDDFPATPWNTYKNEWKGIEDFLGTKREWISYEDAKAYIQRVGIKTSGEFLKWSRSGQRPKNFPSNPGKIYNNQWIDWTSFLGTKKEFMSYKEAMTYIQNQDVKSRAEFQKWKQAGNRPEGFPATPQKFYRKEWISWGEFLGTKNSKMSYEDAKSFVQSLEVQDIKHFFEILREYKEVFPDDFPSSPQRFYRKSGDWKGWNDFLGVVN